MSYDCENPVDAAMLRIWFSQLVHKHLQGCRPMDGLDDLEYLAHYADWDFREIYGFFSDAGRIKGSAPLDVGAVSGWSFKEKNLGAFVFGNKALARGFETWKEGQAQTEQRLFAAYCEGRQEDLDAAAREMAQALCSPAKAPVSGGQPRR